MEAGAVAFVVAGASLLVMATTGDGSLQQLQQLLSSDPKTWLSQSANLTWPLRLFGLASMTAIASFFGNAVAGGFAGLVILYWIVQYAEHGHTGAPPAIPSSPGVPGPGSAGGWGGPQPVPPIGGPYTGGPPPKLP